MEHQQHQNEDNGSSGKGGFVCRQSSTRWTPTTDQIRILKELYYNNGVRSPSADQIQRISARLRQYGKIEGKNVFYWFQNHKARERQKKRFNTNTTSTDNVPMQRHNAGNGNNNKYPNITPGYGTSSSTGVLTVGQIGNYGYSGGSGGATSYAFFDKKRFIGDEEHEEEEELEEEEEPVGPHIETLPLFPMHGEDINAFCSNLKSQSDSCYSANWYRSDDGYTGARASLELSLNSYTGRPF